MNEMAALKQQVDSLRRQNEELERRAVEAEQAVVALARGEIDAVALDSSATPVLLRAAQEALRESRDLLEEAQAISHVGSWTSGFGTDGDIQWSPECYRIFGIPAGAPETVTSFFARVHPDDRERVQLASRAAIDQGAVPDVEHRILRPDGRVRRVHQRGVVERDAAGRAIRMIGTLEDITDRHAAVEALRESEDRYRRIVEGTSEGVWLCDARYITTFMNARMAEMLGYTAREVIGQSIHAFRDEPSRAEALATLERRESGVAGRRDFKLQRKDGTELLVSMQTNPLFDAEGRFEGALALVTDVSAERRADETRARLAAIVESSEDAIMGVDLAGGITSWNFGAEKLYQYSTEEMFGKSVFLLIPPLAWDDERRNLDRVALGETVHQYETTRRRKDGSLVEVAVTLSPVRDAAHTVTGVSKIGRDLTARKHTEAALRRTEEQFRQTQKMEAVGRLAAGVAHDFNNLLSVILSYSSLALDDLKVGDPLRHDMGEIHSAGNRAADLTRQLLAFSRKQILQPRVVDLPDIIAGMKSMVGRLLGEDVELTIAPSHDVGRILADPGQIEQVVMNLAVNARDAMPGGGKLTIEIANVEIAAASAGALGVATGNYVMLAVSDTGVGMDAATISRIFEPFFTTKQQGKGTGLGLATVFGIVTQSGGAVSAYSEPGVGSTFKVYLPRTDKAADVLPSVGPPGALRGSETILLVEDEEQLREVACAILRRNGYHVLEASNGGEAFLISKDFAPPIHLLLTDVVMPRMNGRRLAEVLTPERPQMKLLFVSGYTDDAIVQHGVLAKGVPFLHKPFTPDALLRKVREVLDPGRSGDE